jgi:hypothetical protein
LLSRRESVHEGGSGREGELCPRPPSLLLEAFQQVESAVGSVVFQDGGEGIEPLAGLLGIDIFGLWIVRHA